jgi:glycerol-3-phosphate O-acyltransferase
MSSDDLTDDPYKDIRPYFDHEVPQVLKRLANDNSLIHALAHYKLPVLYRWLPHLTRFFIRRYLNGYLGQVKQVNDLQLRLSGYIEKSIKRTTDQLTYEGLDKLNSNEAYLFISNHRDIVMDPTFVNFALHQNGFPTARIATGDNLLSEPYIEDLMRLNKAFIVKRSISNRREKMAALTKLSEYIGESIQSNNSIWIAHREGRSKDGIDKTDSAVLKMLQLGQRSQTKSFAGAMNNLKLVPVAIAYQYDPCDQMKARELAELKRNGSYKKAKGEDTRSIVNGIVGNKGRVHVAFGEPLTATSDDASEIAQLIDSEIHRLYQLQDTNFAAAELLAGTNDAPKHANALVHLRARLADLGPDEQTQLLQMYANPVYMKQTAHRQQETTAHVTN